MRGGGVGHAAERRVRPWTHRCAAANRRCGPRADHPVLRAHVPMVRTQGARGRRPLSRNVPRSGRQVRVEPLLQGLQEFVWIDVVQVAAAAPIQVQALREARRLGRRRSGVAIDRALELVRRQSASPSIAGVFLHNREGDARGQQQWLSAAGKDVAQRRPTEGLLQNFSLRCRLRFRHRR
jgi:hypothetical protein